MADCLEQAHEFIAFRGAERRQRPFALDEYCRAIGRDPSEIGRLQQVIVSFDDAEGARRELRQWIDAGCTYLVLAPRPPLRTARELAREIIEPVLETVQEGSLIGRSIPEI